MSDLETKLGKWIFEKDIWQVRLEDESGIDSFASSRGLSSFFMGKYIKTLWQLGLLKADLVKASDELSLQGLVYLGEDYFHDKSYSDLRKPIVFSSGLVDSAKGLPELDKKIKLYFHPFRFFVLYHIEKHIRVEFTPIQSVINSKGFAKVLQIEIESAQQSTSSSKFVDNLVLWNQIVDLCIALEPCFYDVMFGVAKHSPKSSYEEFKKEISQYWEELEPILKNIGLDQIEKIRKELCISAEMLDQNKEIHTLLRLTRGEKRFLNTKGQLGGAMVLLTMAELLRRGCEKAFSTKLKEEDELGFGMWISGAKENIYGSDRIVDGNQDVKTQWLRVFGIESGVRVKWYVEGETEYSAIDYAIGDFAPVEIVNLRGKVAEKDIVAFRDSLNTDLKSSRFSFISVDGDRSDYLRAVRKAAEADDFCGMFFASDPDFGNPPVK